MDLTVATIRDLRAALDAGTLTCVELVGLYLNRIGHYDRHGICLNAVPVLNPRVFEEARASDRRRETGKALGPLDGIPYLAKDSYAAAGLTVAAGSLAFENLVAQRDSFAIERLRAAGAILIGLTNMPPMAAGGMQRGLYGRAESPFNAAYLTAAFASGSSNGSGSGTAACFGAFSLAEETWPSGRAPASNNGLCAYTPSRGPISIRGNWPLIATMDAVVPYARCMDDLLEILNALVVEDPQTRGDLWRQQRAVKLPSPSELRPIDFLSLRDRNALAGKRIGVSKMYINKDNGTARPIATRHSILQLWSLAERELRDLGAQIVEVDFPAVTNYEKPAGDAGSLVGRGLIPKEYPPSEGWHLVMHSWDDFLRANGDEHLSSLAQVDGAQIFPLIPGALPDLYEGIPDFAKLTDAAREGVKTLDEIPFLEEGLKGLEQARRIDLENWMDELGLDALVFPAVADVAPADSDYNPLSSMPRGATACGLPMANCAIRHLGIPHHHHLHGGDGRYAHACGPYVCRTRLR
ncbi:MAG: amidase [Steroidobacteraceae bacterium]